MFELLQFTSFFYLYLTFSSILRWCCRLDCQRNVYNQIIKLGETGFSHKRYTFSTTCVETVKRTPHPHFLALSCRCCGEGRLYHSEMVTIMHACDLPIGSARPVSYVDLPANFDVSPSPLLPRAHHLLNGIDACKCCGTACDASLPRVWVTGRKRFGMADTTIRLNEVPIPRE